MAASKRKGKTTRSKSSRSSRSDPAHPLADTERETPPIDSIDNRSHQIALPSHQLAPASTELISADLISNVAPLPTIHVRPTELVPRDSTVGTLAVMIHNAQQALARIETVDDAKKVRAMMDAIKTFAKDAGARRQWIVQAHCDDLRAERQLGVLLKELELAKASLGNQYTEKLDRSHDDTGPITLDELDINKSRSSRLQKLADIPEDVFENWLYQHIDSQKIPTQKAALALAKKLQAGRVQADDNQNEPNDLDELDDVVVIKHTDDPIDELQELIEHDKILNGLLERVYSGGTVTFEHIEGRQIKRLLEESSKIHHWLLAEQKSHRAIEP